MLQSGVTQDWFVLLIRIETPAGVVTIPSGTLVGNDFTHQTPAAKTTTATAPIATAFVGKGLACRCGGRFGGSFTGAGVGTTPASVLRQPEPLELARSTFSTTGSGVVVDTVNV